MASTLDSVIRGLIELEIRLIACHERLAQETDSEALHDLRTTVRRLRSLIRPLRESPGVDRLEAAAKAVGALTTPLRDREVLGAHLHAHGHHDLAQKRIEAMQGVFPEVARSQELTQLLQLLGAIAPFLRTADRLGVTGSVKKTIQKRLRKQWKRLQETMNDPAHDRHRLRLLIKRVRYAAEAYPDLDRTSPKIAKALKNAQGELGDWHDHLQWLLKAKEEPDLRPCVPAWRASQDEAERRSDKALETLARAIE